MLIHNHRAGTDVYSELVTFDHLDEDIAVVCKNEPKSETYRFEIKKSALQRSPVLSKFFNSSDYMYGCGMMLKFYEDHAICMFAVKEYVEQGPDIYDAAALRKYATVGNAPPTVETFTFLVRLHKLANKLELRGLTDTTLVVLHQVELSMTPQSCIALAELVFKDVPFGFQDVIKAFVIKHVDNYFGELERSPAWAQVVTNSSDDFKVKWAKMVITHHERPLSSSSDDKAQALQRRFANTDLAQLFNEVREVEAAQAARTQRLNQIMGQAEDGRDPRSSISSTDTAIRDDVKSASSDDEEEDQLTPLAFGINEKALETLGISPRGSMESNNYSGEYGRRQSDMENAKARRVLGINSDGGGLIAGRVKPSGLSRARKSLNNLMRSS